MFKSALAWLRSVFGRKSRQKSSGRYDDLIEEVRLEMTSLIKRYRR
jgi:hypothetical protein